MNDVRSPSGDTSNDVLFRLEAMHLTDSLNYRIIAQSPSLAEYDGFYRSRHPLDGITPNFGFRSVGCGSELHSMGSGGKRNDGV